MQANGLEDASGASVVAHDDAGNPRLPSADRRRHRRPEGRREDCGRDNAAEGRQEVSAGVLV